MTERLHFVGVSTAGSSIMAIFPRWAKLLGLDAEIAGRDIPLGARPQAFRAVVAEIARDERVRGALVTTHKVDVYSHARDLFAVTDADARLCREISCISKRDGALVGHAKDPLTSGLALQDMLGSRYWRESGAHVLCLGAGGAGTAITVRLLSEARPPVRIAVTDTDPGRLDSLRSIHREAGGTAEVDYQQTSSASEADELVAGLPPRSLVVNATGMGKDAPGSPLTDRAVFPARGVVWELNYRGELEFLRQARRQAAEHELRVHDGWRYFLYGWTAVIAEIFGIHLTPELFGALETAAEPEETA